MAENETEELASFYFDIANGGTYFGLEAYGEEAYSFTISDHPSYAYSSTTVTLFEFCSDPNNFRELAKFAIKAAEILEEAAKFNAGED